MPETASNMIPLGTRAPDFSLIDTRNQQLLSLEQLKSPVATVIMFLSNHCPYVKHIQSTLLSIVKEYAAKGVAFIAIGSNDVEKYPEDSPIRMKEVAEELHYTFPYLYDETQEVAKAYKAACTPDFYVFDANLLCVYRGCMDESTPGNGKPLNGMHLRTTLDCVINEQPVNPQQKPSLGCNIKWKETN